MALIAKIEAAIHSNGAALLRVMVGLLKDDTELFKQYSDNESFKRWLADTVFGLTYEGEAA